MAKILVNEVEYQALKRAQQQQKEKDSPPAQADNINQAAAQRQNQARREDLEPPPEEGEVEDFSQEELPRPEWTAPFLPPSQQKKAQIFVHRLLADPTVRLEQGCLYIRGRKVGYLDLVLHDLFGQNCPLTTHRSELDRFLQQAGLKLTSPKKKTMKKPIDTTTKKKPKEAKRKDRKKVKPKKSTAKKKTKRMPSWTIRPQILQQLQ